MISKTFKKILDSVPDTTTNKVRAWGDRIVMLRKVKNRLKENSSDPNFIATTIQLQVMSQVEKMLMKYCMSREDLAKAIGSTEEYIINLFIVEERLSLETMAKFQLLFDKEWYIDLREDSSTPIP